MITDREEDINLKLAGVLPMLLVVSMHLYLMVPAEVIEYLEAFLFNHSKGFAVLWKNKYKLMEIDIDARFYK